jgi:bifunctional UDP-N-acetylglucosamine pyrophosphorylase/glucosamine-1-phosphate N-acetyltransferase/UDP-N-acetylglucosamine pyrophosphorylase
MENTTDIATAAIILAAGKGKRMKSDIAKVLHEVKNRPMILYVVKAAKDVVGDRIYVVVGHQAAAVKKAISDHYKANFAFQEKQLGTGHAVKCAMKVIPDAIKQVIILCGDVPLVNPETIKKLVHYHCYNDCHLTVVGVKVDDPTGYGRIIVDEKGHFVKIVEQSDANETEKKVNIINSGIYCIETEFLKRYLPMLKQDNKQEELYLTDLVSFGVRDQWQIKVFMASNANECIGVNTIEELKQVESILNS